MANMFHSKRQGGAHGNENFNMNGQGLSERGGVGSQFVNIY